MRISDWSSDVCSSDLALGDGPSAPRPDLPEGQIRRAHTCRFPFGNLRACHPPPLQWRQPRRSKWLASPREGARDTTSGTTPNTTLASMAGWLVSRTWRHRATPSDRSEEQTTALQSLMLIPYAVFCLKKK